MLERLRQGVASTSSGARRAAFGVALVAIAWPAIWLWPGLRAHVLFAPLWLGYVCALDGWTEMRTGTSLCARSPRAFAALFAISVPLWWLFELVNERLANWHYVGREHFSDLEYALFGSLSFSTVVPAVLVSAEWMRGMRWVERFAHGPRLVPRPALVAGFALLGLGTLVVLLTWPRAAYPLVWVSGVFLLEALALVLRRRSLSADLARGDWRPWFALWAGGLFTGFFWELWNVRSYPKWIYDTPGVTRPKLFEMPLLGYLGYLPFALEVYLWKELWLRQPELLKGASEVNARPLERAREDRVLG